MYCVSAGFCSLSAVRTSRTTTAASPNRPTASSAASNSATSLPCCPGDSSPQGVSRGAQSDLAAKGTGFVLLGRIGIVIDGRFHAVQGAKQRTLLAILLMQARQLVPKEKLYEEMWGDRPPATQENSLQAHVSRLRRTLLDLAGKDRRSKAPVLHASSVGYRLDVESERVDATLFLERVSRARSLMTHDGERALALFEDALALWHGSPLQDAATGPFCESVTVRLEEEHAAALEDKLWLASRQEQSAEVIGELQRASAAYPWRERITETLMRTLCDAGRRAEATRVYHDVRARLMDQMGMEPSPRLRELIGQIAAGADGLPLAGH